MRASAGIQQHVNRTMAVLFVVPSRREAGLRRPLASTRKRAYADPGSVRSAVTHTGGQPALAETASTQRRGFRASSRVATPKRVPCREASGR
jgi:hypothetical protein